MNSATFRRYWRQVLCLILLSLFVAPLLVHIYLGSYSRFLADDFCSAAVARSQGIIGGTLYWYSNWSGRFSASFLDSLFGYLGPAATPYATSLVTTIWFALLALTIFRLIRTSEPERGMRRIIAGVMAAMILFTVLKLIPFVGQSLYWGQGMRSVAPPLILATAYVAFVASPPGFLISTKTSFFWLIIAALLTFVAAGFAETHFALQTSAIGFALLVVMITRREAFRTRGFALLVAGLLGSLTAGTIVFVAPGNQFRRGAFPPPPGIVELLRISFRGLAEFFHLIFSSSDGRLTLLGLTSCAFILGLGVFHRERQELRAINRRVWALIWLPPVGLVLLLSCWVPMAYGTSLVLAYRTFIIPMYVLVCLLATWGYLLGQVCYSTYQSVAQRAPAWSRLSLIIILSCFALSAADSSRNMWKHRSVFVGYARAWEEREQMIDNAKAQAIPYAVVRRLHNWAALDELTVDPKIVWLSKCIQDYYGLPVVPDLGDLYGESNGEAKQAEIVSQFQAIPSLPGAVPTEFNSIYRTDRGKMGFYKTDQTPEQIQSFYQTEFSRLAWKYMGEKKVEVFQRLTGGTHRLFCKGDVAAVLFVTGQDERRLGYTYSLALNWGSSSGFVWGKTDCAE